MPSEQEEMDIPLENQDGVNAGSTGSAANADIQEESVVEPVMDNEVEELKKTIEELKAENSDLKDQYLRKHADFENFRKRILREKEESIRYGNSQLLLDLITLLDDFDRAIKSAGEAKDFDSLHQGIVMIEQAFYSTLENRYGLKKIHAKDQNFDPERHEAISMEVRSDIQEAQVMEEYQKGFMLHDRVLRTAKVKVAQPGEETTESGSE